MTEPPTPNRCLDCATPLVGEWCHACGQAARAPIQPARVMLRDIAQEALDLDNRLARTVKTLMTKPGALTLEYVAGRRRRWTSPVRLYLIGAVVYFVVAGWTEPRSFLFITGTDAVELMIDWLPRILAMLVPVFALFDHLLFERGRRLWAESLVFSLHVHAAWFVLSTVAAFEGVLPPNPSDWGFAHFLLTVPVALAQIGIWVYLYLALRRFHGRGHWATGWRMFALIMLHSMAMAAFILPVFFLFA